MLTCADSCSVLPEMSITPQMGIEPSKPMPSLEEVVRYAKPIIKKFIGQYAVDCPREHKDEIEQTAYERIIEAYDRIDADKGWKSFVYNHSRGAVLDYLKFGKGFTEEKWSLNEESEQPKMRQRIFLSNHDDESIDIDHVLGQAGIFNQLDFDQVNIRWDLVAKMASQDELLHVFAKWLRGFNLEEIGQVFGLSRGRVGQMIKEYIKLLDDPILGDSPWTRQAIFAFGLSKKFGMEEKDQSLVFGMEIGHNLHPVNLDSEASFDILNHIQMDMFG